MSYIPQRHHRHSIRLPGYDYTQPGAYFVTMVTHGRALLFGEIVDGEMWLNDAGRIAEQCWWDIPAHFPHVALDAFVMMPNHVHGVLWIVDDPAVADVIGVGAKNFSPLRPPPSDTDQRPRGTSKTIGSVVRGFKIGVTKWFRQNTHIYTIWQRNYYEHIIRTNEELARVRAYIQSNPQRWTEDRENPGGRTSLLA
jgi:putative transposase